MESLESLLDGLEVSVEPFAVCEVGGPMPLDMPPMDTAVLHYTLAGEGRLRLQNREEIRMLPRTVLIIPAGMAQRLTASSIPGDNKTQPLPGCAPLSDGWERICKGSGSPGIQMACAEIHATYHQVQGLFDYLTEPIIERVEENDPIDLAMQSLLHELATPGTGTRAIARALMQQCLVLLLRRQAKQNTDGLPWLGIVRDPRLGRALRAMFQDPSHNHTVESLADQAGMSRSTFAERFMQAFGRGPIDLLIEIRLQHAARLLRSTDLPVKQLAAQIGYDSRSYFSRAFKKLFGLSPAGYRHKRF